MCASERGPVWGGGRCGSGGRDPSGSRVAPGIFPGPWSFRRGCGCGGPLDKESVTVVHVVTCMLMPLYCVAPEVGLLKGG